MNLDVLKQKINQDGRFEVFYNELIKRNQKVNLTAITEKRCLSQALLDSAAACDFSAPILCFGHRLRRGLSVHSAKTVKARFKIFAD